MGTRSLVVIISVGMLSAGCTPVVVPSPTPSVLSSPSATATPSPTPSLNVMQRQAADVVVRFYDVQDQVASDYEVPLNALNEVAAGDLVAQRLKTYQQYRVADVHQTGRSKVAEVRGVDGEVGAFAVTACIDRSAVDLIDKDGKSIIAAGGPRRVVHRFEVREVGGSLRAVKDDAVESC